MFLQKSARMMFITGVSLVLLGVSAAAIDLTGCRPNMPVQIDGLQQLIGDIYSPGYREGQNYPDNSLCQFTISAPFGFRIRLDFRHVDIEAADMCMRDAVEILEITGGQQPRLLGVFCGNMTNVPPIVSLSNKVAIVFRSDNMIVRRGFHIHYVISGMPMICPFGQNVCKNGRCFSPAHICNGQDDCGDGTDEENCGFPTTVADCGTRKVSQADSFDRVIGGKEAVPGSWPWQADLQLSFIQPNGHMCGGTLINAQWVLSAAHCFQQFRQPEAWRIHLGNHHKFKTDSTEQIRRVERIILYPGTTGQELFQLRELDMRNDISLLKLNAPVKITDAVRPACLPNQGYEVPVGTKCMASGWGMTRGTGSNHVLKEVDLSIEKGDVCNGMMGPIDPATMICVRNAKGFQDVCHGDSGGPLVCEQNGKWSVVGATSFGSQGNYEGGLCALPGSATVYSKASHKTNWIRQQINKYS